jgi:hypothetical protein
VDTSEAKKFMSSLDLVEKLMKDSMLCIQNEASGQVGIKVAFTQALLQYCAASMLLIPSKDAIKELTGTSESARYDVREIDRIMNIIMEFTQNPVVLGALACEICLQCCVMLEGEIPGVERLL